MKRSSSPSALVRCTAALALMLCVASASAQRRNMPLAELVDVPISMAATTPLTAERVRSAIVAAALAAEWDVDPEPDGALRLSLLRDFDTRLVVKVSYTTSAYSIRYVSSENLNFSPMGELRKAGPLPLDEHTKDWRSTRSAKQPEFRYAVDKPVVIIHPAYEAYLYELSASIRRHLRWQPL